MDDDQTPSVCAHGPSSGSSRDGVPTLPTAIRGVIGEQLRTMYDDLRSEPIPDRILELLARLDASYAKGAE